MLEQKDGKWVVADRLSFWQSEGPRVTDEMLEKLEQLAVQVLSDSNPELDLPKEQRFAAAVYGDPPRYSKRLRRGMAETLALLGTKGNLAKTCSHNKPKSVAGSAVRRILGEADARRWASLNDVLPILAEAAPDAFLNSVEAAIDKPDGPFLEVFAEEDSGVAGRIYTTGLLWGLEALAWSDDYLVPVCRILANLAAIDPGGNWSNRPLNSLATVLLPWLPQTCAEPEQRHAAVVCVMKEQPEVGWDLLERLLPQRHGVSSGSYKPRWQKFIPENWEAGVSVAQYWEDVSLYATLALSLADAIPERLSRLVDSYFDLPLDFRKSFRQRLLSPQVKALSDADRMVLWMAITQRTKDHRRFADSEYWYQPEELLEELDSIADQLKPLEPEIRHKRLFSGRDFELYEGTENWDEQQRNLQKKREEAARELMERGGLENLLNFAHGVESPFQVGEAYGLDDTVADDEKVLPKFLTSGEGTEAAFASGYVWSRFRKRGWNWVDALPIDQWSLDEKVQFLSLLPFVKETWQRVSDLLGEREGAYWKKTPARPENRENIEIALDKLIANGRSDAAIRCISLLDLIGGEFSTYGLRALEGLENNERPDVHAITEVFSFLQKDDSVDEERLGIMEIRFLGYLNHFNNARPKTLYRWLAERPDFFCEIIRMVYRSKQTEKADEEPDESAAKMAEGGYRLLMDWNLPPGSQRDGSYSDAALKSWFKEAETKCVESGHWEVASHQVGEVLYFAPKDDQNELWINPVCEILDSKQNVELRRGLCIRIFNSRGVHGFSGGKEETELAEKWERRAKLAERRGFSRLGESLRSVAKDYREQAKRAVSERHRFD